MAGQPQSTRSSVTGEPAPFVGLSRLHLLLHYKLRASVAAPQDNWGLRLQAPVWSLLSSRGSKHFYKHPQPSSTPAVVLFALYILLLAEVLCLILRHPARGNSPTPDVEEARLGLQARQGPHHHTCAQPHFSHGCLWQGRQSEKISLGSLHRASD